MNMNEVERQRSPRTDGCGGIKGEKRDDASAGASRDRHGEEV